MFTKINLQKHHYLIISLITIFLFVTFLFLKSKELTSEDNEHFMSNLRYLQGTDAMVNHHLLLLRNGTLVNVDAINVELATINKLYQKLTHIPVFITGKGYHHLIDELKKFKQLMVHKTLLIERFKAENATLQTALVYFPVITQEFIEQARKNPQAQELVIRLQTLLREVLLYYFNPNNPLIQQNILTQIAQLEKNLANSEKVLNQQYLENIITQVQTILRLKPDVEVLINELLLIPTSVKIEKIYADYDRYYEYALQVAHFYKICLYLICIFLILYIAWLIIQHLDQRVRDATYQIRQYAEELREALENERRLSIEKQKMGTYIPKPLVEEISRNREQKLALGGKTVYATILFSDIKGFTKLSEKRDPQEIISFLNTYMTAMTTIIESENGVVDKFIGDGIMAIFTEHETGDHALRAVRAGIEMQKTLLELRQQWMDSKPMFSNLSIRIGINTGKVVAGNIGSETRMDYTVVGDNVNVASRIEGFCEPGKVFISASTYQEVKHLVIAKQMAPIQVKNRDQSVYTYALEVKNALVSGSQKIATI
ncbi:MAG: DAHL domain-containing protein [Candidatus Parabeggiatoa sp.]|nr:DAHL domain-containing protein [Candidatus Parabeggiatoa sp.]